MTGKNCKPNRKHKKTLNIPISNSGTKNKNLQIGKNNPFRGDFF